MHYRLNASEWALQATAAVINGSVFLQSHVGANSALLSRLRVSGGIVFDGAQIDGAVWCQGGSFKPVNGPAIAARGITAKGQVAIRCRAIDGRLIDTLEVHGQIALYRATIGGDLDCQGLRAHGAPALDATAAVIGGSAFLSSAVDYGRAVLLAPFVSEGEIRFYRARVGGTLDFRGATLSVAHGNSLSAAGVVTGADICLSGVTAGGRLLRGFTARGRIDLYGAVVGRDVDGRGMNVTGHAAPDGSVDALAAIAMTAKGSILFGRHMVDGRPVASTTIRGTVHLSRMEVVTLDCSGASFKAIGADGLPKADGDSLQAYAATVKALVRLNEGCAFVGRVSLIEARIGSSLDCTGAIFEADRRPALHADRMVVGGPVFLRRANVHGMIRLFRAEIGSVLDCAGASLRSPGRAALDAYALVVKADCNFTDGFSAAGDVVLESATIGGALRFLGATFGADEGRRVLNLRHARAGRLENLGGQLDDLLVDGLVYDSVTPTDFDSLRRWLKRKPTHPFRPQPYEQLASVLRKMGHESAAKDAAILKRDDFASSGVPFFLEWVWS